MMVTVLPGVENSLDLSNPPARTVAFCCDTPELPSVATRRSPTTFLANSVAKVIHNFGRADQVDRAALAGLVASISR